MLINESSLFNVHCSTFLTQQPTWSCDHLTNKKQIGSPQSLSYIKFTSVYFQQTDPPKRGPQTRNRAETYVLRADFDAYFASDEFESLVNNAVSTELTRFISSEEFKNMFTSSTKSVIPQVVSDVVVTEIEKAVMPFRHQIDSLKAELNNAQIHINHNEQYSRRCNIRIFGIQEIRGENCSEVVINFLKTELGLVISLEDIDRRHRVGPSRGDGSRALIVKFVSYRVKSGA